MTGQRLGDWVLGNEIGRGPVATVYEAQAADEPLRLAAVKVFTHPELLRPEFTGRFAAEMLPLHRLNHPLIVKTYEAGVHLGQAWFAMELVAGTDAATRLRSHAKKPGEPGLPWADELLGILVQVARGLKHGHHRSVLHRNLKPSNVLITPGGLVKLADFGLAKLLPVAPTSLPADPLGALNFLPPEFFTGKPLTRRSDLYSLGCLAYTLLAGRPPFVAAGVAEFTHKHCYTLPDRPALVVPDLPGEFDDWICELLAKNPERRPVSAAAAAEELGQVRAKAERKGRKVPWPADLPGSTADLGLDDAQVGRGADETGPGRPRRPLMARPTVVLPLFLLVVGVTLALLFWPTPTAAELYAQARPLLESKEPADWDAAWERYLEPLSTKYPCEYAAEVRAARAKIDDRRELRNALLFGGRVAPPGEAERWYRRGVKLAQAGDFAAAQATWRNLRTAYAGQVTEAAWLDAADAALAALAARPKPWPLDGVGVSEATVQALRDRRAAGDAAGADAARAALEALYRDDPASLERLRGVP